jgi:hypothetical protein
LEIRDFQAGRALRREPGQASNGGFVPWPVTARGVTGGETREVPTRDANPSGSVLKGDTIPDGNCVLVGSVPRRDAIRDADSFPVGDPDGDSNPVGSVPERDTTPVGSSVSFR